MFSIYLSSKNKLSYLGLIIISILLTLSGIYINHNVCCSSCSAGTGSSNLNKYVNNHIFMSKTTQYCTATFIRWQHCLQILCYFIIKQTHICFIRVTRAKLPLCADIPRFAAFDYSDFPSTNIKLQHLDSTISHLLLSLLSFHPVNPSLCTEWETQPNNRVTSEMWS